MREEFAGIAGLPLWSCSESVCDSRGRKSRALAVPMILGKTRETWRNSRGINAPIPATGV